MRMLVGSVGHSNSARQEMVPGLQFLVDRSKSSSALAPGSAQSLAGHEWQTRVIPKPASLAMLVELGYRRCSSL